MDLLVYAAYIVGGIIRLWLSLSEYKQSISDRVEISTPQNSWKRVTEGSVLYQENTDPYLGDMFHEMPVGLYLFSWMIQNIPQWLQLIFITCDLLTAHLLYKAAIKFTKDLLKRQNQEKSTYAKDVQKLLLSEEELSMAPLYVVSAYLFNPYTVVSCIAQTTTVFANFFLAVYFYSLLHGYREICGISLAFSTLQSVYTAVLIVPACIHTAHQHKNRKLYHIMKTVISFAVSLVILVYICSSIAGGWHFLYSTFGFVLNVPDLRPNVGLFWYFFTEMFEHFRALFICVFQLNASLLYVAPLSLRLNNEPVLLATSLTALIAIFKSYPSIGDVGFYLALLPMWKHLFLYMQQGFVVGCVFLVTSVLGPNLWHLWIYSRSANANFYFGVTLAFATAQIFLITDILFAYIKREFALKHGLQRVIDGEEAKLVLE